LNYRQGSPWSEANAAAGAHGINVVTTQARTNYPVTLSVDDYGDRIELSAQTDISISAERLIEYACTALCAVVDALDHAPHTMAVAVDVLPRGEHRKILEDLSARRLTCGNDQLLHELFEAQVRRTPHSVAVKCESATLTYAQLNAVANQLAALMRDQGVQPDECVAICMERSVEMVVGLLAILKSGGAFLPLDPDYPEERMAYVVDDAAPRVLLTQKSLQTRFTRTTPTIIMLDEVWERLADYSPENFDTRRAGLGPGNLAYVIYTSGSTGRPKGVMVEHANVVRLFAATQASFAFNEQDVWTLFHSTAFDFSVWELWGALLYGGRVIVVPYLTARSPHDFYELLCREGVTVLNQTPSAFANLIEAQVDSSRMHALRVVIFGGEALELRMLRPWIRRTPLDTTKLVNMYGITETTVHVTYHVLSKEEIEGEQGSPIGMPLPDLCIYILNHHQNLVPIGVIGEIYVGGDGVARGYLNQPTLTRQRFLADPFREEGPARIYRSGDMARWRLDGALEYVGRNDQQVKIRGFRIELGEIEAQLLSNSSVRAAIVKVHECGPGGKVLIAYVIKGVSTSTDARLAADLREALQATLPAYMVPATIVILERFPLTQNGKIDKDALPVPERSGYYGQRYARPQGAKEETLAAIWTGLLMIERVGRDDNFFSLGGNSLTALRLVVRVREAFHVRLDVAAVFRSPTVCELAQLITSVVDPTPVSSDRLSQEMGDIEYEEGSL
jgi:amino acid adenylation domain-containing protein